MPFTVYNKIDGVKQILLDADKDKISRNSSNNKHLNYTIDTAKKYG